MDEQPKMLTIKGECGNCAAWLAVEMAGPVTIGEARRGRCIGVPPHPAPVYGGGMRIVGQKNLWAHTLENECCLLFRPRADLITGAAPQGEAEGG